MRKLIQARIFESFAELSKILDSTKQKKRDKDGMLYQCFSSDKQFRCYRKVDGFHDVNFIFTPLKINLHIPKTQKQHEVSKDMHKDMRTILSKYFHGSL